ncbi:MAG: hypothetical protein ABIN58_11570 [candidate division WOR-3 bacterium]
MSATALVAIVMLLGVAMGLWLWIAILRHRIVKETAGRIKATIIRTTGRKISAFVPYDGNAVWIKIKDDQIIAIEPPTRMQPKRASKQAADLVGAGMYMFDNASLVKTFWPYERGLMKALLSVEVSEVIWVEDNPEPVTNRRLREMLDRVEEIALQHQSETIPGMTATPKMITSYCDQTTMLVTAALEEQYRELQESFVALTRKWINPAIVYIALGIGIIGAVAASVMMYLMKNEIAQLKEVLGL